ncbi:MAG: septum formation initiator family protein [Candidatus Cloacimonadales bacterium]|nr:septum formation initiator family protein [Candidatus Cloacimonadales bacterium]
MKLKKKDIIFYSIIFLLIIYIAFIDSASYYRRYRTKQKLEIVKADLETMIQENQRLQEENKKLEHDRSIWEKKARELGMQKNGDEVFMFKEESK